MEPLQEGPLAPGLYFAAPNEKPLMLDSGHYLDFQDFRNACEVIRVARVNASRTFGTLALHLAKEGPANTAWTIHPYVSWSTGYPNSTSTRNQLLIATQTVADLVGGYEAGEFEDDYTFTRMNWRVMWATLRDIPDEELIGMLAHPQ